MKVVRTPHASIPLWVIEHPVVKANRTVLHVYAAMYFDADFNQRTGAADWEAITARTGLAKATVYRDVKAMRDAGIIRLVGQDLYLMPIDDGSTTVEGFSTTVEDSSMGGERAFLTELQNSSIASPSTGRPRDLIFEAVCEASNINIEELTSSGRGPLNRACAELRGVHATPDDIRARAGAWRQMHPDIPVTPTTLSKNWAALGTVKKRPQRGLAPAGPPKLYNEEGREIATADR